MRDTLLRRCKACGVIKPLSDFQQKTFYLKSGELSRYHEWKCKLCRDAYNSKKYYETLESRAGELAELEKVANILTKLCHHCNQEKALSRFPREPKSSDGRRYKCYDCINQSDRERAAKRRKDTELLSLKTLKRCSVCDKEKPRTDFHVNYRRNEGLQQQCKKCINARERAWQKKTSEKKNAVRDAKR
jgi:hypothetical protein